MRYIDSIFNMLQDMEHNEIVQVRDYCSELIRKTEPAPITLGEMDDKMYAEQDRNISDQLSEKDVFNSAEEMYNEHKGLDITPKTYEITEDEYNELFQSDAKDQFNEVETDITKRSQEYSNGRPLDP